MGGLGAAFLGFGECDGRGNVNASRFGVRIPACGGFINISQNARKIVFVGTFTSAGLEVAVEDRRVRIASEGKFAKFVDSVAQTTFSTDYARRRKQAVAGGTLRHRALRVPTDRARAAAERTGTGHRHRARHSGADALQANHRSASDDGPGDFSAAGDGPPRAPARATRSLIAGRSSADGRYFGCGTMRR